MRPNKLRQLLNEGKPSIAHHVASTSPDVVEIIGRAGGVDYVEFVAEYMPYDLHSLDNFGRALELTGMSGMIKVDQENKTYTAGRALGSGLQNILFSDTRTVEEYRGELVSSPGSDQSGIYRAGRIPGATHAPWDDGAAEDGTFLPAEDLRRTYDGAGLDPSDEVVPYCRLGVRASYSWFVLKYLLGYERVRNYDGSWTEWGNSTGVPIETDAT